MSRQEAVLQYNKALKMGQRCYRNRVHRGEYPYPQVLDEILDDSMVAGYIDLGVLEIPIDQIEGTKSAGRQSVFAANYMPLPDPETEFGMKWISLCEAHLGDMGITDPIRCYEYMGRFYVQEGNKRVSVLKSYGAPVILASVIRVVPVWSEDAEVRIYYEFLQFYELSRIYRIHFNQTGGFAKLQAALGFDEDHVWSEEERKGFLSQFHTFKEVYDKLDVRRQPVTTAEALLVWLQVYRFSDLKEMTISQLEKSLLAIWPDIEAVGKGGPIQVSTTPEMPDKGFFERMIDSVRLPSHLNVAFIYEMEPDESRWLSVHDQGRKILDLAMGDQVSTCSYVVTSEETAEELMERAREDGAQVLIAASASLIFACRKMAAKYPGLYILNCSASMPYLGVRTYYSRMYEVKFILGAVAGAVSGEDSIGYIAGLPIFGVPAGINAFALGARMTNPRAKVKLLWSGTSEDALEQLVKEGLGVISDCDIPFPGQKKEFLGLCQTNKGRMETLAIPVWDWGRFYIRLISSILHGSWNALSAKNGDRAVNYWWGIDSRVIGVQLYQTLPDSVRELAEILERGIGDGSINPFHRFIRRQDGTVFNDKSRFPDAEEILHMDWLCDLVEGEIPAYEELLPRMKELVRLQGIYRDYVPPKKEEPFL